MSEADLKVKINLHNDAISHSDMHCVSKSVIVAWRRLFQHIAFILSAALTLNHIDVQAYYYNIMSENSIECETIQQLDAENKC
ncbi:hypothetical protein T4A_1613, partial [Trichinella pseudospiralis]